MYLGHFSKCGNMMDDIAFPADRKLPVVVIVNDEVPPHTSIVDILKTELVGFEIAEMETTSDLNGLTGRDVRLIAFNTGHTEITDPSVENRLALIAKLCPTAHVALLSNREDEATVSAAMQRGVRGFLPSSLAVEVAVAGLRLVLAGGVYRPLPIIKSIKQQASWNAPAPLNCQRFTSITDFPSLCRRECWPT